MRCLHKELGGRAQFRYNRKGLGVRPRGKEESECANDHHLLHNKPPEKKISAFTYAAKKPPGRAADE
jgi:hypothetical protein